MLLVLVAILAAIAIPMTVLRLASPNLPRAPYSIVGTDASRWAGYVTETATGSVYDVKGTITVPTILCPSTPAELRAVSVVGIDGTTSNNPFVLAGVEYVCDSGSPSYYAWYDWYPATPRRYPTLHLNPGDRIIAEIRWDSNQFVISLRDATSNWSVQQTNSTIGNVVERTSAEWVVASLLSNGTRVPLTPFDKVFFSDCYATIGQTTAPMGTFSLTQDTMVDANGSIKARPILPFYNDGTSFSVWWVAEGP